MNKVNSLIMKKIGKKIINCYIGILLFGLFMPLSLNATEIVPGKVYRFKNVGKPGNVMAISGAVQGAVGAVSNSADLKQQWYITTSQDGSGFISAMCQTELIWEVPNNFIPNGQ